MIWLDVFAALFQRLRHRSVHADAMTGLAIFQNLQQLRRFRQGHQQHFGGHGAPLLWMLLSVMSSSPDGTARCNGRATQSTSRSGVPIARFTHT
ncbi:MAG: hypothetical protein ACJ8OJ_08960 [Povalibacter sp.]|jgi:hypothetical protein